MNEKKTVNAKTNIEDLKNSGTINIYNSDGKKLKFLIIGGVIIFVSLIGYWYTTSNQSVVIKENNSTNSTIELRNDNNNSVSEKEIEFSKNQTKNSTIKVFQ